MGADADSWESVQVTSSLLTVVELSLSSRQHHQRAGVGGGRGGSWHREDDREAVI